MFTVRNQGTGTTEAMKTLYLLRHAKSSWDHIDISDFDRPLNERGYMDAHLVSGHLSKKNITIDVVLSSPAIRAMSTALIFSSSMKFPVDRIQIRKNLYDSDVQRYLECIADEIEGNNMLLVGHNETITEAVQKLSLQRIIEMKTCSLVALQFDILSWKEIVSAKGNLLFQMDPGNIKDA